MIEVTVDGIPFHLKQAHDFSFLSRYGKVFSVIDSTGSGCLCFGIENDRQKVFVKVAGADTTEAEVTPLESVELLKHAAELYRTLAHPCLIHLLEAYAYEDLYVAVFDYAQGECLFDHWNFDDYKAHPEVLTPMQKFFALQEEKKLKAVEVLFSFLMHCARLGYVAVDFYDSSILYDFVHDKVTLCDIDLFQKGPVINETGVNYWGTRRFKAPEEYVKGAVIDERTNEFTLAAMLFSFFSTITKEETDRRYKTMEVVPVERSAFSLHDEAYAVLCKAMSQDKEERYATISLFYEQWRKAIENQ